MHAAATQQLPVAEISNTMDPPNEGDPPLDRHQGNEEAVDAFASLIAATGPPRIKATVNKFLKSLMIFQKFPFVLLFLAKQRCLSLNVV